VRRAARDRRPRVEADAPDRRLELAHLLGLEPAGLGGREREQEAGLAAAAAARPARDQAVPLQLAQLGLQRPRPRAGLVADVGGPPERPAAPEVEVPVDVPEDQAEALDAERAGVLADPAHVVDGGPEPRAPEPRPEPARLVLTIRTAGPHGGRPSP
jgi:hypothetical protein